MKVNSILVSAMLGFAIGAQPILGFNYGAKNYARVRKTYLTVISMTLSVSAICWFAFITTPETIVSIFGDNSPQFNEFASKAMRSFLGASICIGIQLPSANYFQAVGKPFKAMILTTCKQILLLVPAILILPFFFHLEGVLYAGPVADLCSLMVTTFFIVKEMRHLGKAIASGKETERSPHLIG
jgi:Na+-driven multidrug efflux pump